LRKGAPFADLPEPLQQLRRPLPRETGSERVMAKISRWFLAPGWTL